MSEIDFPGWYILTMHLDAQGVILNANQRFLDLTGFKILELTGKSYTELLHSDVPEEIYLSLCETLNLIQSASAILKLCGKDNKHFWADVSVSVTMHDLELTSYFVVLTKPKVEQVSVASRIYAKLSQDRAG